MTQRLDTVLAHLGLGSRREVGSWVRAGRVSLAGQIITDPGHKLDPDRIELAVDGEIISYQQFFHRLIHKPAGYVTATSGRDGPLITQLPGIPGRDDWMPVGRLDKDTEGLLLLTTDGELAHRLTHPRWKVNKRYLAHLEKPATPADVAAFAQGIDLGDEVCRPAVLEVGSLPDRVQVIISEGKFHQVKRMFGACNNRVTYLKRIEFGPLQLPPDLLVGQSRWLLPQEEAQLYAAVGLTR